MATAPMDDWTEEKCVQLIRQFRSRPVLWDKKDPFFFKKTVKPDAWNEISEAMNTSAGACRHKMVVLMSSFRREKAKILHSIKSRDGSAQSYTSTWFAFKEMAFLMDKETERKQNKRKEPFEDDASMKEALLKHHIGGPLRQELKKPKLSTSIKNELTKKAGDVTQENVPVTPSPGLQHLGPVQTPSEREEEIISFTSFVGYKMKNYTDSTKNAVQQAICRIIFKADQHYYEGAEIGKYTIIDADSDPLQKSECQTVATTRVREQSSSDSDSI